MNSLRRVWRQLTGKDPVPLPQEVREALEVSTLQAQEANRKADEAAQRVAPLREANKRNHFESAIRAMLQGRPV